MFKPSWQHGFTKERNIMGWRKEGIIPFNRNALWQLREEEEAKRTTWASGASWNSTRITLTNESASTRASIVHGGPTERRCSHSVLPAPLASKLTHSKANKVNPQDFAAISLAEKLDIFMKQQELLDEVCDNTIQRRQECSSDMEDDDDEQAIYEQEVLKTKITAAPAWNKHGSVTGEEVLALARAKARENEKEKQEATARLQERAAKKRRMIVESVTMGNTMLARIAEQGDAAQRLSPAWLSKSCRCSFATQTPKLRL
jgi:hypothetical protein